MNFIVFYFACGIFVFRQIHFVDENTQCFIEKCEHVYKTYTKRASCQTHAILYTHMRFFKTNFDTCFNASNFRRIFTMKLRF